MRLSFATVLGLALAGQVLAQEITVTPLEGSPIGGEATTAVPEVILDLSEGAEAGQPLDLPQAPIVSIEAAENVADGTGGLVRVLDKITGAVTDLTLANGETAQVDLIRVTLTLCRYPADNPAGDAFGYLTVSYRDGPDPVFDGWMFASAPALNAMDHPRYDVWMLRCTME